MDEHDFKAMDDLADRTDLWVRNSAYLGSCILTEEGRIERDRLAAQYRRLAGAELTALDSIVRSFPIALDRVRKKGLDELCQTDWEWISNWFQQIAKLAQEGSEEVRRRRAQKGEHDG